jgi:predicted PurR-regulated permease PerM
MSHQKFELSYTSIIRVILVLAVIFFLYLIREILALLFISLVFATAVGPWVGWFEEKFKIPRSLSVIIIYVLVIGIFGLAITLLIPPLTEQVGQIAVSFPEFYNNIVTTFSGTADTPDPLVVSNINRILGSFQGSLEKVTGNIFGAVTAIFGNLISIAAVLVITFYMVIDERGIKRIIRSVVPKKSEEYAMGLAGRIEKKMGLWLRGQLVLMFVVGLLTYILLSIFGVKYALILAVVAGVLEVIPFIGPIVSAIPAILIALTTGPAWQVLAVALIYIGVQQIENNVIVPKIMQKAVGLNPIIVISAILMGAKLGGVVGAILAVPVAAAIAVVVGDMFQIQALEQIAPEKTKK